MSDVLKQEETHWQHSPFPRSLQESVKFLVMWQQVELHKENIVQEKSKWVALHLRRIWSRTRKLVSREKRWSRWDKKQPGKIMLLWTLMANTFTFWVVYPHCLRHDSCLTLLWGLKTYLHIQCWGIVETVNQVSEYPRVGFACFVMHHVTSVANMKLPRGPRLFWLHNIFTTMTELLQEQPHESHCTTAGTPQR